MAMRKRVDQVASPDAHLHAPNGGQQRRLRSNFVETWIYADFRMAGWVATSHYFPFFPFPLFPDFLNLVIYGIGIGAKKIIFE